MKNFIVYLRVKIIIPISERNGCFHAKGFLNHQLRITSGRFAFSLLNNIHTRYKFRRPWHTGRRFSLAKILASPQGDSFLWQKLLRRLFSSEDSVYIDMASTSLRKINYLFKYFQLLVFLTNWSVKTGKERILCFCCIVYGRICGQVVINKYIHVLVARGKSVVWDVKSAHIVTRKSPNIVF